MEEKFKYPTEEIELPSKGLIYDSNSPLASGRITMKYMTAKEEDILTNINFIKQGIVIDKLLQSMIVTPGVDYNELLNGDKNAILVAARILGYGKDYDFMYNNPDTGNQEKATIDLSTIETNPIDESLFTRGKNEFDFQLPFSKVNVTFKILNHGDETKIDKEIKGLEKINPNNVTTITTRLKHILLSVNGNRDTTVIREFVDNMLARDVKALRNHINKTTPDLNLKVNAVKANGDVLEGIDLPIGVSFFWPDAEL